MRRLRVGTGTSETELRYTDKVVFRLNGNDIDTDLVMIEENTDEHPIEEALFDHKVDLLVERAKDMPFLDDGDEITVAAVLRRAEVRAAYIGIKGKEMSEAKKVYVPDRRRFQQFKLENPMVDTDIMPYDAEEMLRAIRRGECEGAVVDGADALIFDMDSLSDISLTLLPLESYLPEAGSGITAIITFKGGMVEEIVEKMNSSYTYIELEAEKAFLENVDPDILDMVSVNAAIENSDICIRASVVRAGKRLFFEEKAPLREAEQLAKELASRF